MRPLRALVLAAALLAPSGGSAAATSCSPNVGPYPCPVQASAQVWGELEYCEEMIGAPGWYCGLVWHEYFSGGAVTPGAVTISEYGVPMSGGCRWVTTGCSGERTQWQGVIVDFCGPVSTTFEFEATATSALGTVTDYATATVSFANPYC